MTPAQLKAIRLKLGLSRLAMGHALCYSGNADLQIGRFERGDRPIPPWIARLAWYMAEYGVRIEWTVSN
jgi:transcriptional regulator with XRE-family HTH domain